MLNLISILYYKKRANNRILYLRVIGSASLRLAL